MTKFKKNVVFTRIGYMGREEQVTGWASKHFGIVDYGKHLRYITHLNSTIDLHSDYMTMKDTKDLITKLEALPVEWDKVTGQNFRNIHCLEEIKTLCGRGANMKTCTRCGHTKLLGDFYTSSKGRITPACKDCIKAANNRWRVTPEGKEYIRKANAKHRIKNGDALRARGANYREANREFLREYNKVKQREHRARKKELEQ